MVDEKIQINDPEKGEIRRKRSKSLRNHSYSEEDGGDMAEALDIKPPQATLRHQKSGSSHRREKHSEHRSRHDVKDRKNRHRDKSENRIRDKHRNRKHDGEHSNRSKRSSNPKRIRESSRHERKERNTGDRVLEDLRERLLDKRRERREDRDFKTESYREELRDGRERRDHREDPRHSTMGERQPREKRRKRSHKHEKVRDHDREKSTRTSVQVEPEEELMDAKIIEEIEQLEQKENALSIPLQIPIPQRENISEQELRRQRLLEADREMLKRKENSRLELEARRMKRGERRRRKQTVIKVPSVVELSDDSPPSLPQSPEVSLVSPKSNGSSEHKQIGNSSQEEVETSDSSESSSTDDDESNKNSDESNDESEFDHSPLSVGRLAKSDQSDGGSPEHMESNGDSKIIEMEYEGMEKFENEIAEEDNEDEKLPPYLPAIQGCRSVEEYRCLERIEEGTYGIVYKAEDRRTKEIVALKRLKMEKEKEGFPITSLREINTILKAQHPNIITVREIVLGSNTDKIFIVMDYMEHDLKSLMETMKRKKQVFLPGEVKCLMQQLLRAVAHLHDNWILHRDLKTSNLLFNHQGILKVADFGLAREYGSPLKQYTPIVVTLWYRAPELLLGGKEYFYSTPIDLWSVGCIFGELLRMEALFRAETDIELINKIFKELGTPNDRVWPAFSKLPLVQKVTFSQYPVNNLRQRFDVTFSDLGIDLMNKFLTYNPQKRVTAEDALKHGYFEETPLPISPQMFPTWPSRSEIGSRTTNASPKPPSGGRKFKNLENDDEAEMNSSGFYMGQKEGEKQPPIGGGFHLKF